MSYIIHLRMLKTLKALNLKTDVSKCQYVLDSQSLPHQEVSFEKKNLYNNYLDEANR